MIKTVLFDLDGTLLPLDQKVFVKEYFAGLARKLAPYGYESQKLVDGIWAGVGAMVKNNTDKFNEEIWWETFETIFGKKALKDKRIFEEYYEEDFGNVKNVCGFNSEAARTIYKLKESGFRVVLATNPIFPALATEQRIGWAGLSPSDFEFYTTYENSHRCKPNLEYYKEILGKIGCCPEECLMVGNDVAEDMIAKELGMEVFLLKDFLINSKDKDISEYPQGSFDELLSYIESFKKNFGNFEKT